MVSNKLKIRYYGDPALKKVSSKIDIVTEDIRKLALNMIEAMHEYDGVGLAAPQVGLNLNLVVVNLSPEHAGGFPISPGEALLLPQMPVVFVNPEIISSGAKTEVVEEGCLSVPEIYVSIERPTEITLNAQLLTGEAVNVECAGFLARVLQHEVDHLKGVLFIDRIDPGDSRKVKRKLDKLKKHLTKKGLIN